MEAVLKEFWSGRKVFLTGHTGFKGSWLSLWLQDLGAEVLGYALDPPSTTNLFEAAGVAAGMQSIRGDILNLGEMQRVMRDFAPEVVLHLAAQSLVRRSYQDPIGTFQTNVLGTANLLECVRHCPSVRSVVVATSDKCYENLERERPYRETDPLGGHDPYSASKACAELVAASFSASFCPSPNAPQGGPAIATARAGNVIGGGDWAKDRLIPDILRAFDAGEAVSIRNPGALRPWQHVLEPLRGYLQLAHALFLEGAKFSGAWNFGPRPDDVRPVEWIVQWLAKDWGPDAEWEIDAGVHPHEARVLKLDCSKSEAYLLWQPWLHLEEALALTVAWHRQFLAKADLRRECSRQISEYLRGHTPS